ncbi:hypothetical protein Tco_0291001 [Tanacetum coccineum]
MNEDTPVGVASAVKDGVAPFVVDMTVEVKKLSSLEDTTVLGSFPPLSTPVTTFGCYARVMIELQADVELKDSIIVDMPKIIGESHYICNFRVEYECKPPRCVSCNVFGHIHEECPKNTSAGEKKTLKKPSQTSRGVLVGLKMGFKPQKEYSAIPKKTYSLALCGNKKKGVGVSTSTTPIIDKIEKFEELLTSGKATLVEKLKGSYWHSKFAENNGGIRNGK